MRNVKNPSQFRKVAEELHALGPKIIEVNGKDIKIGCENKDYQRLLENGTVDQQKARKHLFEAEKHARRYAMWEKIIEQAKILTAYGGGHIPITKLEGTRVGGWR